MGRNPTLLVSKMKFGADEPGSYDHPGESAHLVAVTAWECSPGGPGTFRLAYRERVAVRYQTTVDYLYPPGRRGRPERRVDDQLPGTSRRNRPVRIGVVGIAQGNG